MNWKQFLTFRNPIYNPNRSARRVERIMNEFPNTFQTLDETQKASRPHVFDPSLKHFGRAFRLGDYVSSSAHERLEWELARADVRNHLLQIVADSRWRNHLVLRGSTLMQAWFGDAARDPKDIDWVFQPENVKLGDPMCEACFADLIERVKANPHVGNTQILTSQIAVDDIWTYERAAGRRVIFPFQTGDGSQREIQMDIVWSEPLFDAPITLELSTTGTSLLAATPQLSLAWKLLWLVTDGHPQGKDLYDAVLLAENTRLPFELLNRVLQSDEWIQKYRKVEWELFRDLDVDWPNFKLEFPWIEGEEKQWRERLLVALSSTFANAS